MISEIQLEELNPLLVPLQKLMDTLLDETIPISTIEAEINKFFQDYPPEEYAVTVLYAIEYVSAIRPKIRLKYLPLAYRIKNDYHIGTRTLPVTVITKTCDSRTIFRTAMKYTYTSVPMEIAIRNDNLEAVKGIVSRKFFDFEKSTLINLAAFYGSIECFKYLYLNGTRILSDTHTYVICGGNTEMIRYLQHIGQDYTDKDVLVSVLFHHNQITDWLISQGKSTDGMEVQAAQSYNFRAFCYIQRTTVFFLWSNILFTMKDVYNYPLIRLYIEDSPPETVPKYVRTILFIAFNSHNERVKNFIINHYSDKFDEVAKKFFNPIE